MALPIKDGKITCPYKKVGKMWSKGYHSGCDFAVKTGTEVLAVADGTVANANWGKSYGVQIVEDLGDGTFFIYAHLSKSLVKPGDKISKNQVIGKSGNTGNSSGPHLHVELRSGPRWSTSKDLDPAKVLAS
jgi:murein DD-endopeptidase MepM/ murein hydrolase activator NlpD